MSVPSMLPAPGRLSITNDGPRLSASFCPRMRAMTSELPPGAYGTMKRTGLAGYVCAVAAVAAAATSSQHKLKTKRISTKQKRRSIAAPWPAPAAVWRSLALPGRVCRSFSRLRGRGFRLGLLPVGACLIRHVGDRAREFDIGKIGIAAPRRHLTHTLDRIRGEPVLAFRDELAPRRLV